MTTTQTATTPRRIVLTNQAMCPAASTEDNVYWLVDDFAGSLTPSQVAAAVKISLHEAREILLSLVAEGFITVTGNGAWARYTSNA